MTNPGTKKDGVLVKYGFICMLISAFLFMFLMIMPAIVPDVNVDGCQSVLRLKIGDNAYSYPVVLLGIGLILMMSNYIGPAIAKKFKL